VASGVPSSSVPPRPVASAAPGSIDLEERRRDKGKKRKKGKKSVDQEAVAQNISRTLASIKGPIARKGGHRREEGPSFRDIQDEKRREEKEREKTLVRVNEFITVSELANISKCRPRRSSRSPSGAGADGDDQPAPRFRHDRADRVGVQLPGRARGRLRSGGRRH